MCVLRKLCNTATGATALTGFAQEHVPSGAVLRRSEPSTQVRLVSVTVSSLGDRAALLCIVKPFNTAQRLAPSVAFWCKSTEHQGCIEFAFCSFVTHLVLVPLLITSSSQLGRLGDPGL